MVKDSSGISLIGSILDRQTRRLQAGHVGGQRSHSLMFWRDIITDMAHLKPAHVKSAGKEREVRY